MADLYQAIILRHYHTPSNHGVLKKHSKRFVGANPFCGDEVTIDVELDKGNKIKAIGWDGHGCVISQAATSIFSTMVQGKTLDQVKKMTSKGLLEALNVELSPTRMKCALLPLYTLKNEHDDQISVKNE